MNLGSVETIGNYAFENCQHLQGTLDLTSVKSLGEFAFKFCDELSGVRFGNDLTTIPDSAFAYCNITSLEVPGNVTTIGKEAFADCPIHSLKLNEGLVSIGESAFYLSLTEELELPSTLRSIGRAGLIDTNYNRIILNEGLISVGYNGIRTEGVLTVPSTVKSLAPRENESLIVLGKPFASRYDYSFMNWNGNNTIYTWYPREQWGNPAAWGVNEFQYVEFRILEPEIIELHEGQTLKLPDDPEQYELLDGWRVALDNGVLTAQKPCADVLIQTVDGQNIYHLIRVYPIPESCKNGLHTWSLTSTTPPDCITTGQTTYTCTACGATREETVPALGHAWTLTEILNEAEEGGHASMGLYTCSRCNETKEARLCAAEVFTDMPKEGNWAHDPIDWAYFNGITAGKTDNSFAPKDTVTRAEAVSFLWRTLGKPEPTTEENPFTDVPEGKYYTLPVLWAYENGITSGTTETTFGPKDKCTRSQIMVFIWAAAGKPEPTLEENPFTDVPEGKSYTKAVLWAYENGITSGIDEGLYGPKNSCTRAQIVAFLYKALPFLTAAQEPGPGPEQFTP